MYKRLFKGLFATTILYLQGMKNVSILVPESSVIQAIADPQYLFSVVNQFLAMNGKPHLFRVELVAVKKEIKLNNGMFSVQAHTLLKDVKKTDLVIIPALFGNMAEAIQLNKKAQSWIVKQYRQGAEVASLCVGAFLLASTGLLNGKKCSTHWGFAHEFNQMFPRVTLADGHTVTEENGIYSSGGAHSYWNLLLHLVEKYTNRETAILASKYFAIDINRNSQLAFTIFNGQKNHTDAAVKNAQEYIEHNVQEKISVDEIASQLALGRRSFERRFRQATHNSVLEYIQRVKIEWAKRQLENSRKSISEIMYAVGYTDPKSFRDIFKKVTGLTPIEYRNKYNKAKLTEDF